MKSISHLPYEVDEATNRYHYYENHWKRIALSLLASQAANVQGWTLLDYGCGRGETMQYAAEMGMVPFGLDSDANCVQLSSRFGKTSLLDVTKPDLQVLPSSFDVVACFHVLEHVENPKQILTLLGRAARRYVLVAVPNLQQIPNLRRPWAPPAQTNPGHLQSWDHSHFKNLAEMHCGLKLVSWASDATIVPIASELARKLFGTNAVIWLETGLFRRLFPYWAVSVIALLKPAAHNH